VEKLNSWFLRCKGWNSLQMSANEYTMKFYVHESFEFGGFCTWPSWSVHHGICRWLGGLFCEKMKFVVFEIRWLEWPTNVPK